MLKELYIFDFDDTLALTNSHVRVLKSNGVTYRLNSREFAKYRLKSGDELDFSEFNQAEGTLINDTVTAMESAIASSGIENVYIVTARSDSAPVQKFLSTLGVTVPKIVATSGSEGKATWLTRTLNKKVYQSVWVYEDCKKNITMLKDIVDAFNEISADSQPKIKYNAICILPDGNQEIIENKLRKYIKYILNSV